MLPPQNRISNRQKILQYNKIMVYHLYKIWFVFKELFKNSPFNYYFFFSLEKEHIMNLGQIH